MNKGESLRVYCLSCFVVDFGMRLAFVLILCTEELEENWRGKMVVE